ncbi:hypothetical protein CLIB1423_14S03180 [[Candida] railenensis]|uniref:PH-response regulator protein palH/RIM21 n=1 Tax=[Candida] railenensis TaxID=45579 RepID=A0A9P0W009_9ASCO|nr:hypothetical protein CLIB1423_14S03180 [[Candida] railenensis]
MYLAREEFIEHRPYVPDNCSIYSLSMGHVVIDWYNGTTSQNLSLGFLPAYYITNCSVDSLLQFMNSSNFTSILNDYAPLASLNDSGSSFIAILFTASGTCVSSWMLCLLLYLSPKYKRKPISSQVATLFYSIVCTIFLSKVTAAASNQYYSDFLDVLDLHDKVYRHAAYRATIIISQILTLIAFFQINYHMTKGRYRWVSLGSGGLLMVVYIICFIVFQTKHNDNFRSYVTHDNNRWDLTCVIFKILTMCWVAGTLIYYTVIVKNPVKISYSRRVLGLSVLTWILFLLHIILELLIITLFDNNSLVKFWMTFLPLIIEIFLLTIIWEWIYNIAMLDKREEMSGVLGRRMSMDDVTSINSNIKSSRNLDSIRGKYKLHLGRKTKAISDDSPKSPSLLSKLKRRFENGKIVGNSVRSAPVTELINPTTSASNTATVESNSTSTIKTANNITSANTNGSNGSTRTGVPESISSQNNLTTEDPSYPHFSSEGASALASQRTSYDIGVPEDHFSLGNSLNRSTYSHEEVHYNYEFSDSE